MKIRCAYDKLIPLGDLKPHPRNRNKHPKEQITRLAEILKYQGVRKPIIVSNLSGFMTAGHGRLDAARAAGLKSFPVNFQDYDDEAQEYADLTADNAVALWAEIDLSGVNGDIADLGPDFNIDMLGIEGFTIDVADRDGLTDPNAVPEPPKKAKTKLGDLYLLGEHRLLCGDSVITEDVDRLMNGEKAQFVFTDPPWNVDYGAVEKGNAQGYKPRKIMNDKMEPDDWKQFIDGITASLFRATLPGCPLYLVMSAQEWPVIDLSLREAGFHWSSTIIWAKDRLVLSRKDYHTQYEPIWYGWNNGAARLVPLKDRKQSDLWQVDRPSKSDLHPTTKPVELVERAIINSSPKDALGLDLFGGSGSTLIAAETTKRRANVMELDPIYCDVIARRWEEFTGRKAILDGPRAIKKKRLKA